MRRSPLLPLVLAAALAACTAKSPDPCSNEGQRAWLASVVSAWYLYPELLPRRIDPDRVEEPAALLEWLTEGGRAAGKDRGWSYLTTAAEQRQFFAEGTFVGFGVSTLLRGGRLMVTQVFPGSAAAAAGFRRGDEIVAIGTGAALTPIATLLAADEACRQATPSAPCNALGDAFGPAIVGLPRTLEVVPRGETVAARRPMAKSSYGLDPVPPPVIIERPGTTPAAYLLLRAFIEPAEPLLVSAFAELQARGVTDVIVDVRYNGGGLLTTADRLANLLLASSPGSTMFALTHNPARAAFDVNDLFVSPPLAQAITPAHVAFLVSDGSASASELVPNVLAPYVPTALVGHQTYGKPVGQRGFWNQCGTFAYIVAFDLRNASGYGGYYGGLPAAGFAGCGIVADDDLGHDLGDPAEAQTAAALQWFSSPASCPAHLGPLAEAAGAAGAMSASAPAGRDVFPVAVRPTAAQRHLPGLF